MKVLKQALTVLGALLVIAALAAIVAPKTARSTVATLAQVVHTLANPAPTVLADEPDVFEAGAPFNCQFIGTELCTVDLYSVPAHKVAAMESVSGVCFDLAPPNTVREFQMHLSGPGGVPVQLSFVPSPPVSSTAGNVTIVGQNFKAYAFGGASGSTISMNVFTSTVASGAVCSLEVIGRLSEDSHSDDR